MTPLLERYTFRYNEIDVHVQIDYLTQTVSLIEANGEDKSWKFANRTSEYMQGWVAILSAMSEAVEDAEKRLKAYEDKKHDKFVDLLVAVQESEGKL